LSSGQEARVQKEVSLRLARDPNDIIALNALAVHMMKTKRLDMAEIILARALSASPKNASLLNNLGVLYWLQGKEKEAFSEWQRTLDIDDEHPQATFHIGAILLKYGNWKSAVPLLERAYANLGQPKMVGPHLAEAYRLAKRPENANTIYESGGLWEDVSPEAQLNFALLLVTDLKDKTQALSVLNKIRFSSREPAILKKVNDYKNRAKALK